MKKSVENKMIFSFLLVIFLIINVFASVCMSENELQIDKKVFFHSSKGNMTLTVPIGPYEIKNSEKDQKIFVENFGCLSVPGKPALPSKIFSIAIPPGTEVVEVNYDVCESIVVPGIYNISPAPLTRTVNLEDSSGYEHEQMYAENFDSVYGSDDPYPSSVIEFVCNAHYRKYNLADIRVTPFTYRPFSGHLIYYPKITLHINYKLSEQTKDEIIDNLAGSEHIAEKLIFNYDQTKTWYPSNTVMTRGLHDYVIITIDALTSSVSPLVDWETNKGRTVEVVNVSWINSSYQGYDLAEKIRKFLRDKYPSSEWGIEDVLLVGHPDDIPMRCTWQDMGYGKPSTDFYYAELSLSDSKSWDADEDHKYGEDSDPIDFYSEVNVGRIPWSDPDIVLNICNKSAAYEQDNNPTYKKNMLLLGAFFWNDTDNAKLMEQISDQPYLTEWTITRMYEKNEDYWSKYECDFPLLHKNVLDMWSHNRYAFVNWAGHGTPISAHILGLNTPSFISSHDALFLNDQYPSVIFANSCSNMDSDYPNIGQVMMKQGAVGFLGPTKVSHAVNKWWHPNDGSSQSFDYFFSTKFTSGNYTLGGAHQEALREMYTNGLWNFNRYEMFEWSTLFGNPNLGVKTIGDFPFIEVDEIKGGLGITSIIKNSGSAVASDVQCIISIRNGLSIITKDASYTIPFLAVGESTEISMPVFGFGLGIFTHFPAITVTAGVPYANTVEKMITAKIIGPFVILQ